jgi:hypothetical protein
LEQAQYSNGAAFRAKGNGGEIVAVAHAVAATHASIIPAGPDSGGAFHNRAAVGIRDHAANNDGETGRNSN